MTPRLSSETPGVLGETHTHGDTHTRRDSTHPVSRKTTGE